ncbi:MULTISPECIES: TIGR00454 family protein [unclassified Archaeoglobus]|jgi:adenosylcobinamide-phosphate guanylyltransferase|uniref:TIGR00454 family protein n=1 Tax=unclassified Archaeoglobus TaxID=2643606 RepID=UPI0025C32976|nr:MULTISPECIES: TIGR00454 family protein [unclassified Archaeoglobus]
MHALLMCGGRGERLGRGEKPLFEVCGMKLIEHSIVEFENFDVLAVTSPNTPETERFLMDEGIDFYRASGKGFIEDYREVCVEMSIAEPVFIACADIVYIRNGIAERALESYMTSTKRALRVVIGGKSVGLNIIDAFFIDEAQEEEIYNVEENSLINVNTLKDAERAEKLWTMTRKGKGLQKD